MRIAALSSIAVLALAAAVPALAAEEHRELGPHVHGHGTLNIAVEDKRVGLELEAPGMDIVGFEHAASNGEQEDAVAKAKARLADALSLFKIPEAAGCKVQTADIEIEAGHHHEHAGDDDADHGKHADADHDHEKHADADGDHDHEHSGHTEFHVTYTMDCAKPSSLTSIGFDYFKAFANARSLTVNVVTDKGQSSYEVSREKPQLDLTGVM